MATTNEGQKVSLKSSDGEVFDVDLAVAKKSGTIARWLESEEEEKDPDGFIPIQNVKGSVLALVIDYCKNHVVEKEVEYGFKSKSDLDLFDENFMEVDQKTIFDLIQAANYLDIKGLLDLCCRTVAEMMKQKSIEQIRDTFNIKNDYTKEEEAEIKAESAWAFEKN
ncbi:SKP1-like protein [Rhynchospora pubera]|uniref:SKP1-like protein n=1 Tax=Rhynchospora pubera TaxID=906938 RepID=A0AAV8GPP7_9POAL|nr:SKP1-like protein [Rhynchospora pubera]KAJ4806290.1 SKP1-like protein [Rhynchospora pubera]